jgi:hypothetical protein
VLIVLTSLRSILEVDLAGQRVIAEPGVGTRSGLAAVDGGLAVGLTAGVLVLDLPPLHTK